MRKFRKIRLCTAAALCLVFLGAALWLGTLLYQRGEALRELEQNRGNYDPRSIVLQNTSHAEAQRLARRYGAELRITGDGSYARLTLPEGTDILDVFARGESLADIGKMSADYRSQVAEMIPSRPHYTVTDPDYSLQTYLDYLNLEDVWNQTRGSGVRVAVIDTGIDTDHPEFAGRISELSYNATEDKVVRDHGWNVIEDEQGHGTAVSGVIAAAMDGVGTVGIAPEVELVVIKAESDSAGNFLRTSDLVFGLYYAIEVDAQVVNMSFGGQEPENVYEDAAALAWERGVFCIAATGNNGGSALSWPAADEHVIGVGSIGADWTLERYSNYGENVDLVAPGTVYTTRAGGGYRSVSGTSFSCPMVAAAAALLADRETDPEAIRELLFASCRDLGTPGRDYEYGFGVPDVSALVQGQRGTVTFDMRTDGVENVERTFLRGIAMQELPVPESQQAVFDGWYYDPDFSRQYRYYSDVFREDLTLYAKWVNGDVGVPYTYAVLGDGTVEIRSFTGQAELLVIPEKIGGKTVCAIGDFAFENQTRLRQVELPESLTKIGRGAFKGCSGLTQIRIPGAVTLIREEAFRDAVQLRTLIFGADSKLETLEGFVFAGCASLEKLELPASLEKVSGTDFFGAVSMTRITVAPGSGKFSHKDGVLFNAAGDTVVVYPAGKGSHYDLPEGTVRIGDYAFAHAQLDTVDLTGLEKINEGAFVHACLKEVTIPDSVNRIGEHAFEGCASLETARLGQGITILPEGMFRGCRALKNLSVPANIKKIGVEAFAEAGITQLRFPENSLLKTVEERAFFGNAGLISLELPEGLETVGDQAFWNCGVTSVTIPASVKELGIGAFGRCERLEGILVAQGNENYHSVDGVLLNRENTLLHTFPAGKNVETYTTAESVQRIERLAFAGTNKLENLVLTDGITVLGEDALLDGGFRTLALPGTLTEIGEYAVAETRRLESVTVPGNVRKLGRCAFAGSKVRSVFFEAGSCLTHIGAFAFYGCSELTELTVPESVEQIGFGALPHIHRYTDTVTEPDCVHEGFTTHTCACGDSFTDSEVPALGHDMQNGVCTRCGEEEPQGTPGDANGDGKADYSDALMILRASIGLGEMDEDLVKRCDMNGDGKADYSDALIILRKSIGLE